MDRFPIHTKAKKRQEKRYHFKTSPLPCSEEAFSILRHFRNPQTVLALNSPSRRGVFIVAAMFVLLLLTSYLGVSLCKHILGAFAEAFDKILETMTGEKLWSDFMGVESRIVTVSTVFVLYLIVAVMVQLFHFY